MGGVACGPEPIPIPDSDPFGELAPQVHFGMMVADLREIRPNFYIGKDGTYGEELMTHDVTYLFAPKADDRPPPPTARLLAVESRREYWDTLRLWPEWRRLVATYSADSHLTPLCSVFGDARITLTRAVFGGGPMRRVTADIRRGPDGQSFESFLVVRIGTGSGEMPWEGEVRWRPAECAALEAFP